MKTITTPVVAFAALLTAISACHKTGTPAVPEINMCTGKNDAGTDNPVTITPCGDPVTLSLLAGQYVEAGSVTVYNTEDSLYITFVTDGNWKMGKTHLYVGDTASIPSTSNGHPRTGSFPYSRAHALYATYDRYVIALSALPSCFIVAAHAELREISPDGAILRSQTGWAEGKSFNESGSWAMFSKYCKQDCTSCTHATESLSINGGQALTEHRFAII